MANRRAACVIFNETQPQLWKTYAWHQFKWHTEWLRLLILQTSNQLQQAS